MGSINPMGPSMNTMMNGQHFNMGAMNSMHPPVRNGSYGGGNNSSDPFSNLSNLGPGQPKKR